MKNTLEILRQESEELMRILKNGSIVIKQDDNLTRKEKTSIIKIVKVTK